MTGLGTFLILIGAPGAGKSTWAARHFPADAIVSSDRMRQLVSGDESNQAATPAAMRVLTAIVEGRLEHRQTVVVDATNARPDQRQDLIDAGWRYNCPPIAVVFDVPLAVCLDRNQQRPQPRRVPEPFVRTTHARVAAEFPHATVQHPAWFEFGLWLVHDGPAQVGGVVPARHRSASWLAGAQRTGLVLARTSASS